MVKQKTNGIWINETFLYIHTISTYVLHIISILSTKAANELLLKAGLNTCCRNKKIAQGEIQTIEFNRHE